MALAGTNTSMLLETLEEVFGQVDLDTTTSSVSSEITTTEKQPEEPLKETPKDLSTPTVKENKLVTAKLVFPMKSIPLVIAGLPESLLPLCGPETLSCYRCQYPSCHLEISQKAATCNHVHRDHLNVALACLYCSFENNPKMHWYSTSAWEHHTHKHAQDNLCIFPDDPAFFQQFTHVPIDESIPSTSKSPPEFPNYEIIQQKAQAAKQFLEEESGHGHTFHCPSPTLKPSHQEQEVSKQRIKQGPVKSSKK